MSYKEIIALFLLTVTYSLTNHTVSFNAATGDGLTLLNQQTLAAVTGDTFTFDINFTKSNSASFEPKILGYWVYSSSFVLDSTGTGYPGGGGTFPVPTTNGSAIAGPTISWTAGRVDQYSFFTTALITNYLQEF